MIRMFFDSEKLSRNSYVYSVDRHNLTLITDFRIKLFELWKNGMITEISEELSKAGRGTDKVGMDYISILINQFKK